MLHCDGFHLISGSLPTLPPSSSSPSLNRPSSNPTLFPTRTRFASIRAGATARDGSTLKPLSEMSFYELLGIPETVTLPEIKQAYKQLARKYHPDVSPPEKVPEYTDRFIRVQEAYEILSDPTKRAIYDRDLARGIHLAFSARKRLDRFHQEVEDKREWRNRWEGQLSGLKKRSMHKDATPNMSWGARMRRQRDESSSSSPSS